MGEKKSFDVIVMGGGPGGSCVATFLAQKGHRVLLLEKERFPRFCIGESLVPGIWDIWDALGVTPLIEAGGFLVKRGVNFSIFNAPEDITLLTGEYPEYFKRPYAYHVERARFDEILLNYARRNGVDVREGWTVKDVLFDESRAIGVLTSPTGEDVQPHTIFAPIIVDSTGRASFLARKLGLRKPNPVLNKVSYFTHFRGADARETDGTYQTDIHTIDGGGWIWYIPLANDLVSVGVVVDSKHDFGTKDPQERFDKAIASSPRIHEWIGSAEQVLEMKVITSISYLNDSFFGDGFVLVGDAIMFIDPVFSAGVTVAMRSGMFAAEAIHDAFETGDFSPLRFTPYDERLRHPITNLIKMIYNWYRILQLKDHDNVFFRSRKIPILKERLIVLLSGGYDRADMESFVKEEEERLMNRVDDQVI